MLRQDQVVRRYTLEFTFRLAVFLAVAMVCVWDRTRLDFRRAESLLPAGVLWLCILLSTLAQLSPGSRLTIGCMKQYPDRFDPVPDYEPQALRQAVRTQDRGALKVLAVWLGVNLGFGALFHLGVLDVPELVLLCALCYLCDLVCVLFFCPFQFFLMRNRCCVNCRIFAWGSWMMAAPLMLVPHLYAQSLFWTGVLVLAVWEVRYRRHPERFWSGSNRTLQCAQCREQLCRYKNHLYKIR